MLLTNTINATASIEIILGGNACVCATEPCGCSADSAQFADWQPAHPQAKRMRLRSMCASGYSDSGMSWSSSMLHRCTNHPVSKRTLRSVLGCVTVS